jgi:virginiamycin B lyase
VVTEYGAGALARLNRFTGQVVEYPLPTPNGGPLGITFGPDGALWIVQREADRVARFTLDGRFTEYALPAGSFPNRIVAGLDGALW